MNSTSRAGGSQIYFDYYAFTKATVTSVALMALSVGAMKGIQHYAKRTITPIQRNIAGVVLTAVYMVVVARFFGVLIKKDDPLPLSSTVVDNTPPSDLSQQDRQIKQDGEDSLIDLSPQQSLEGEESGSLSLSPDPMKRQDSVEEVSEIDLSSGSSDEEVTILPDPQVEGDEKGFVLQQGSSVDLNELGAGGLGVVEQPVVELPHSEMSGQKRVLRVEASRPATHLEDEDLVLVESLGYADAEIPKNLPPPSVEEILHLKEPREQVRRIYNYYKDDLKEREQVLALRDLLLGCYKSHSKHHQLVLAVSKKLLEKKLIPFSGNPFHEFWSPLLFEVKELRRGFSYVTIARKDKTSSSFTDLFYLRQLNTHGQSQRLTDCFLEDLEQKKQQHDKVIRIKRLGQLLISSKYAKNSRFNENFEHSMLFAVLMGSDLSKGSVNWLFNRNDQAEFLGEVLDFFELHAFLRPFGGLRNLKQCMLKRAAATYVEKGHRSEEVLRELQDVRLLTDSETVNCFFGAENSGTDLDIFTIYHNYPDLFEADLAPNFMMNVLRNTLKILEAEKEQEGRKYLASDPQARIFVQLLPNKFFSHLKQSQAVAFILNHFLAEFPHYFVYHLFDGYPDSKAFLSHHMNLIPSHVAVNMEGVWPKLNREFKEGLLSEVFDIIAQLKSDHDLRQLDRILQSKILPMLQCEGSLHTLIEEYSNGGGQFNANLRKMRFHQE